MTASNDAAIRQMLEQANKRIHDAKHAAHVSALDGFYAGTIWANRFSMWTAGIAGGAIALGISNADSLIALFGKQPVGLMLVCLLLSAGLGVLCRLAGSTEERREIERSVPDRFEYTVPPDVQNVYFEELLKTLPWWEVPGERVKLRRWKEDLTPPIRNVGYWVILQRGLIGAQLICMVAGLLLPVVTLIH